MVIPNFFLFSKQDECTPLNTRFSNASWFYFRAIASPAWFHAISRNSAQHENSSAQFRKTEFQLETLLETYWCWHEITLNLEYVCIYSWYIILNYGKPFKLRPTAFFFTPLKWKYQGLVWISSETHGLIVAVVLISRKTF